MKIVKVMYTTNAGFSLTNQQNIKKVMDDLQQQNYPGINYNACICPDKKTFIHTAFFKTDKTKSS